MIKEEDNILKRIVPIAMIIFALGEIVAIMVRACYGIEVTDEAFYLSMAYQVLQGRVPFADIWSLASGSAFCYAWVLNVYKLFVPDLEGVFLFTRIIFHILRGLILFYGFWVLKKYIGNLYAFFAVSVIFPYYTLIGNFSYNSVPVFLIILAGFLIMEEILHDNKNKYRSLSAGIVVALSVYSHPCELFNAAIIGIIILLFSDQKIKTGLFYLCGGVGTGIVVVAWSVIKCGGIDKFVYGMNLMRDTATSIEKLPIGADILEICTDIQAELKALALVILVSFVAMFLCMLLKKEILQAGRVCALYGLSAWFLFAVIRNVRMDQEHFYNVVGLASAVGSIAVFLLADKDRCNGVIFFSLAVPNIIFCLALGVLAESGIAVRMYLMIPCLMAFILLIARTLQSVQGETKSVPQVGIVISITASIFLIYADYQYIYRDSSVPELTTRVDSGLYRGLYTTETNAESISTLENIVQENVRAEDKIVVMDCMPAVYMMTEAIAFAPTTWDVIRYHNGQNNPETMMRYFRLAEDTPDKIIYVSNPYKENLSIDDPDFLFNVYVNNHYHLMEQNYLNQTYDLRIYTAD